MKRRLLVPFVVIGLGALTILLVRQRAAERAALDEKTAASQSPRLSPRHSENPTASAAERSGAANQKPAMLLASALDTLRTGDPARIQQILSRLDSAFAEREGDSAAEIAAIFEFLSSGADAPTGGQFIVGEKGVLAGSPTLRVWLLDRLGRLSKGTDGTEALEISRKILGTFGSADEWAVSMRNVAWFDPAARVYLEERVTAMLTHQPWREQPAIGMLEAFDFIVHTAAVSAVPEMERLIQTPQSPLARASAVALDRLAAQHPLELQTLLNERPEILSARPELRASLFAHGNPAIPVQRQRMENYLLRPDLAPRERSTFFHSLIQTGQFVSHNLVTPFVPPESPEQARARLQVLQQTTRAWLADPRFEPIRQDLTNLDGKVNRILAEIAADSGPDGE